MPLIILVLCLFGKTAVAQEPVFGIAQRTVTYIDKTRATPAFANFAGAPDRRLDVMVWYPVVQGGGAHGPWPLVLYSHGTYGHADNATHIVRELASHGYVVAAPNFPLTSSASFTQVPRADVSDVHNQPKDLSFIIDSLLADAVFAPMIDPHKIGSIGHSLGAVTNYFAVFEQRTREQRIAATALLGAGDPVQAALSNDMGLVGSWPAFVHVPVLFVSAEKDVFAHLTGGPHTAYSRVFAPKYEVTVQKGVHVWMRDSTDQPADNKNPDCLFFERSVPGMVVPGCEERVPLIGPAKEQEITRTAVRAFFDAYLKGSQAAHARLLGIDGQFPGDTVMIHEELPVAMRP